jgi:pilus assembly protein Flp/PilA
VTVGESAMKKALVRLGRKLAANRNGATAIEYGLIAALIVIAMIAALQNLAGVTSQMWNDVNTKVNTSH